MALDVVVEVVGVVDQAHPGAEAGGQAGQLLVGGVDLGFGEVRRLVDDQVGGGEPVDQAGVERRVGAEAQRPAAGADAEGRRGDRVERRPALDRERAERHRRPTRSARSCSK